MYDMIYNISNGSLSMKKELEAKRQVLLEEISTLEGMVRGTIVESKRRCTRKTCECQRKKSKMHPFRYLSVAEGVGKTKNVYVKETEMAAFTGAINQYKRLKEIIEELSAINTKLIKLGDKND